ncbi:MAG: hypothetical protein C9356_15685 [Oleiphilus sp.]|nr:MAG: hypothetical protein C9356_15685 [Oleiphilus sp.]
MNNSNFNRRVAMLTADHKTMRFTNLGLALCLLLTISLLSQKSETVILMPPKLDKPIKVANNLADKGYKELWATSIAQMAGNVTPKTIQFVADYISGFMSSDMYHQFAGEIGSKVYKIQQEGRTTRFVPRDVAYEEQTDKVFVIGDYFVTTDMTAYADRKNRREVPRQKVYEFVIDISDGKPLVKHFDSYLGDMRDLSYLAREAAIKEKQGAK